MASPGSPDKIFETIAAIRVALARGEDGAALRYLRQAAQQTDSLVQTVAHLHGELTRVTGDVTTYLGAAMGSQA